MPIKIIAAVAENGVIGNGDALPFDIPADRKRFKELTIGHTVVQGPKTFGGIVKMIHRPLPGRQNFILTRHPERYRCDGVTVLDSWDKVLELSEHRDVFIIGGALLYQQAMPYASELHITRVLASPKGDVFFPEWDPDDWTRVASSRLKELGNNQFPFVWETYRRRSARFIEMSNIRDGVQNTDMQEILELGVCPFCMENFTRWHTKPILWEGQHWILTENKYPYPWTKPVFEDDPDGAKVHLMIVLKTHAENAGQIPCGAFEEIGTLLRWAEVKFGIEGGGFFMRFGEPIWTGGTIRHVHAHIVQRKDLETPAALFLSEFRPFAGTPAER